MIYPRPRWAGSAYLWLTDGQYDRLVAQGVPDGWRWSWRERVQLGGLWLLCRIFGHHPTPDQCNKPEHDLCGFCNKPMPFMAERAS